MIDISNLSPEIEKFEDKWIAIDESEEKIVGVGDNALEATADAERLLRLWPAQRVCLIERDNC